MSLIYLEAIDRIRVNSLFIAEGNAPADPIRPGVSLPVYREYFYGEPLCGAGRILAIPLWQGMGALGGVTIVMGVRVRKIWPLS